MLGAVRRQRKLKQVDLAEEVLGVDGIDADEVSAVSGKLEAEHKAAAEKRAKEVFAAGVHSGLAELFREAGVPLEPYKAALVDKGADLRPEDLKLVSDACAVQVFTDAGVSSLGHCVRLAAALKRDRHAEKQKRKDGGSSFRPAASGLIGGGLSGKSSEEDPSEPNGNGQHAGKSKLFPSIPLAPSSQVVKRQSVIVDM